jgi:hypothetical protein
MMAIKSGPRLNVCSSKPRESNLGRCFVSDKKFKVGDEVVIKGTVYRTDDSQVPYLVRLNDGDTCWFMEKNLELVPVPQVLAVGAYVTSSKHPELGVAKIIQDLDSDRDYKLRFAGEKTQYAKADRLTVVPTPSDTSIYELKFKVGDLVIHRGEEKLGPGEIVLIDNSSVPYKFRFSNGEHSWGSIETCTAYVKPVVPEPKFKVGDKVLHLNKWKEWGVGTIRMVSTGTYSNAEYIEEGKGYVNIEEPGPYYDVRYANDIWESPERLLVRAKGV